MKTFLFLIIALISSPPVLAQQNTEAGRYRLRKHLSSQDTVYMKIGETKTVLIKGWTITETDQK